jgi:hypothetical protein
MKKAEVIQALALLRVAYPGFYARVNEQDVALTVELWAKVFEKDDAQVVTFALEQLITQQTGFPPDIAAVRGKINEITLAVLDEPTNEDLWNLLARAASNGYYGCYQEFKRLPPILQRYLGVPETLRELAQMSESTFQTVVKGQFFKQIDSLRERERFSATTPNNVKALLTPPNRALPQARLGESEHNV